MQITEGLTIILKEHYDIFPGRFLKIKIHIFLTFLFLIKIDYQAWAETIDLRQLGFNMAVMTSDISSGSTFWDGGQLCHALDMELPKAKELLQIWCHAVLPTFIDKTIRKECTRVGISNTIPNFKIESEEADYWSSTPDDIAENWARGVDFKKGVYYITKGNHLGRIRCIKRF